MAGLACAGMLAGRCGLAAPQCEEARLIKAEDGVCRPEREDALPSIVNNVSA